MNHIIMLLFRHVHIILNWSLRLESTHPSPSTSVSLLYGYHRRLLQTVQIEYATTLKIRHQMQVKKNRARVTNSRRHDLK